MKTRKVISAIIAGACAISALAIPASAAATSAQSAAYTDAATISLSANTSLVSPTLNVVLPTQAAIVAYLNPYGMEKDSTGAAISTDGITSPVYKVRNLGGDCGVKIMTSLLVTTKGKATLAQSDETGSLGTDTNNKVYPQLTGKVSQAQVQYDKTYKYETAEVTFGSPTTLDFQDATKFTFDEEEAKNSSGTLTVATEGLLMTIPAATGTTGTKGFTPTNYSYGTFQVTGKISGGEGVADTWKNTDGVDLSIAFRIVPAVNK